MKVDPTNRVIIVDDEEMYCRILKRRLESLGYNPRYATSGTECLDLAGEKVPKVFIVDWMMPQMDGLELIRRIREDAELAGSYVIMLTAKSGSLERKQAMDAGADEFLTKPVDGDTLNSQLKAGIRITTLNWELKEMEQKLKNESKA